MTISTRDREQLKAAFGQALERDIPLARYTSARIGGPAEYLVEVRSAVELAKTAKELWQLQIPFRILGGGSNVLVSDAGVTGVVVINKARKVRFDQEADPPRVQAESGASLGSVARRAVDRGLSGLEWAATIPGTIGGAVVNNAGAHGGDTAGQLMLAEILQHKEGVVSWGPEQLDYDYRSSRLKGSNEQAVVLSATFRLELSSAEKTRATMQEYVDHRRETQPTGASWGSMFKNPEGNYAGRLIEAAGLKGVRVGQAEVSRHHANFFVNLGGATASDVWQLLMKVQAEVRQQFDVNLELEIERIGDWEPMNADHSQVGGAA